MITQALLGARILMSNFTTFNEPYKLNFYLTDECNSRCLTCNIWNKNSMDELNASEIMKFFEKNNHFQWIDLTGGEIFLRRDIDKIFNIIMRNCKQLYLLHFPTNGILTERIYKSVKQIRKYFNGKLVVTVSIDGPSKVHDSIRGVKGCWRKAVETFKRISKDDWNNVFFGYTLSKHNFGKLQETFIELKKEIPNLHYNKIHLNLAQPSDIYYSNIENKLRIDSDLAIKEIEFLISKRSASLKPYHLIENRFLRNLCKYSVNYCHPLKQCGALNDTVSINPKGDVYPCLFFNNRLGNLREINFDLSKILNNAKSLELKKNILQYCPHCWTACEAYPSIMSGLLRGY